MKPLLILRPEPGASATAEKARELGLAPVVAPLFKVEPVDWAITEPGRFDALLLTSANAVRHAGSQLTALAHLPVHCVGSATAAEARKAGLAVASIGESGVDALLAGLPPGLRLLHLCGEHRREPNAAKQPIEPIAAYRAVEIDRPEAFPPAGETVALLHSPRAARRFRELASGKSAIALAAISAETAAAAGDGWLSVDVADEPNDAALLALASRLCNNPR